MILTRKFLREAAILAGLSLVLGLAVNIHLIKRWLEGDFDQGFISAKSFPGVIMITLPEAEDLFHRGEAVFIDARPEAERLEGWIPGSRHVPYEKVERQALKELSDGIPEDKPIVVYCEGGDCLSSLGLARFLVVVRHREVRVFLGGWAEWKQAGLPVETGR